MNATTHGLTAKTVVLATESDEEFQLLLQSYREDWQPQNSTEDALVEQMAASQWRERRMWAVETDQKKTGTQTPNGRPPALRPVPRPPPP